MHISKHGASKTSIFIQASGISRKVSNIVTLNFTEEFIQDPKQIIFDVYIYATKQLTNK